MDLLHKFLNILLPPITLICLLFILPSYYAFKFLSFTKRSLFSENVAGKVVLITGAASGIGEQMAYEYARRGAYLVLVDTREDRLRAVAEKAQHLGSPDVISVQADVSQVDDCKKFIDAAINHFGRLDHLVNNAGIAKSKLFVNVKHVSNYTSIMDVNFWGTVYGTHFALPHLIKSKGQITVISSTCGWYPLPSLSIYNASKAALINFFETLRTEIGSDVGITIVTPGLINSEMVQNNLSLFKASRMLIPMQSTEGCARAIVRSSCRRDKYLVEPSWVRAAYLLKVLCPEFSENCNRLAMKARRSPTTISQLNYQTKGIIVASREAKTN